MKRKTVYLLTTFLWSYLFWGIGIYLSYLYNSAIPLTENLIMDLLKGTLDISNNSILFFLCVFLAAFGPLVGAFVVYSKDLKAKNRFLSLFNFSFKKKYLLQVLVIILTISVLPIVLISLLTKANIQTESVGLLISFFAIFSLLQFFSSATEEIGWRGYLLPLYLDRGMSMWEASLRVGVIWAIWHFPILIYMFFIQGIPAYGIILSVFGFTIGTVAMSLIHTYFLVKSRSLLLSMIIHALYNAIPLTLALIFTNSYYAAVITQVGMWAVVGYIEKREGRVFDDPILLN